MNIVSTHRSENSFCHDLVGEMKVGLHPKVYELVQEVFNTKPPQPKHTFIWDAQTALNFINNKKITNNELYLKLTMLIALTSASKSIKIHHLKIEKWVN